MESMGKYLRSRKKIVVIKISLIIFIIILGAVNLMWFWNHPNPYLDSTLNVVVASYLLIIGFQSIKTNTIRTLILFNIALFLLLINILSFLTG